MRALKLVVLTAALMVWTPTAAMAGLGLKRCTTIPGFVCGQLSVPLDRSGAQPGTLSLRVAAEPRSKRHRGILIALTGGPGQGGVASAPGFQAALDPLLRTRRLVVIDQRGTGGSNPLNCPAVQSAGGLDPVVPSIVRDCAQRLGPRRVRYATADTVADLDALRAAFGAAKAGVMGISYGTFVATQYARTYPDRVEQLILDSVVGADGIDAFLLDSHRRVARVLAEQCRGTRCRGATSDPAGDLASVAAAAAEGRVAGNIPGSDGRLRPSALSGSSELVLLLIAGDLNPFLQPALPGALAAARDGDWAPLLRLRRMGDGGRDSVRDFSGALNVTTLCADSRLPYALTSAVESRPSRIENALDAIPPAEYAPFDRQAVLTNSIADDCQLWPEGDDPTAPDTSPLPDVPTLVLNGRLDLRTPIENAAEVAAEIPSAQTVFVPGTGHDTVDSDLTGCVTVALRRFASHKPVGAPCSGRSNQVTPFPKPPTRAPTGPTGVVDAVLETISDAQITAAQAVYSGLDPLRGGGLRGGRWTAGDDGSTVVLHRYSYVRGLRVSGRAFSNDTVTVGRFRVDGPGRLDGVVRIARGGRLTATIGGKHVRRRLTPTATAAHARTETLMTVLRGRLRTRPEALSR